MRKEDGEYRTLKTNATQADAAMSAWAAMRPGVAGWRLRRSPAIPSPAWARGRCFPSLARAATALPHHHTGQSKLQAGDAVVVDIGAGFGLFLGHHPHGAAR